MIWKLFLDDQWSDPGMTLRHPPDGFIPCRSSAEAITLIKEVGCLPEFISFDHDLGGDDNSIKFIDYMIEHHYNDEVPAYQVHSQNPEGAKNIISKMESWKKSQSL